MDTVPSISRLRKRAEHAALTGGTWMQNLAAWCAANAGRRNGSLTGRYDRVVHPNGQRRDEPRLNCITVGLKDGPQGWRGLGDGTVGSPKQVALVQADTRGKNVSVANSKPALWSESPAR